jgi:hypothetical protein
MLTMGICVAQDLVNIILGTIKKVDSNTKTLVVFELGGKALDQPSESVEGLRLEENK